MMDAKKIIYIILGILVIAMAIQFQSKINIETEPDVVSCIRFNRDEILTVVANRNEIDDITAFSELLIEMRIKNAFHSVKFSDDLGYAQSLKIVVYLSEKEVEKAEPYMIAEYKPIENEADYDIVNNPDMYELNIEICF